MFPRYTLVFLSLVHSAVSSTLTFLKPGVCDGKKLGIRGHSAAAKKRTGFSSP
jgi:hypothetical protein